MERSELVNRVKTILNEAGEDVTLSIADDVLSLTDYIERALPDAVAVIAKEGLKINPTSLTSISDGKVALPDEFLSIIEVKLDNWNIALTGVEKKGSLAYRRAMNQYTAPTRNNPICFREGANSIVCLPKGDIDVFLYNAALGETFNGDEVAANAVAYMAASMVLSIFGDDAGAARLKNIAMEALQ